jgi:hypothetical protein
VSGFWVVMEEGLESLYSKISLTEGEKVGIKVVEDDVEETRVKSKNCLVGKLWTERAINKEAFRTVLSRLWRTVGQVVFKELQDNCWLFEFSGESDRQRVMAGRPWSYDRVALVLIDFDGQTALSQMDFMHTPIWVQVHDMPLLCMNRSVGVKIGASLGTVEDVDVAGDGAGWGSCLRLRVVINLGKPMERGRALEFGGKSHWVSFKYEKLPLCCFQCGRVVHGRHGCPVRKSQRLHADEQDKQWGSWIRADGTQRIRNATGTPGGGSTHSGETSTAEGSRGNFSPVSHDVRSLRGEGNGVGRGMHGEVERREVWDVNRGKVGGGESSGIRGGVNGGISMHGKHVSPSGVQRQLAQEEVADSGRGAQQIGADNVSSELDRGAQQMGARKVSSELDRGAQQMGAHKVSSDLDRGAQHTLAQNLGSTCMDASPVRVPRSVSHDVLVDEGCHVDGVVSIDAGLGGKFPAPRGLTLSPTGQNFPLANAITSDVPTLVPCMPFTRDNSSLRGWKRQARAGRATDVGSSSGGNHKRKPEDGVPVGRTGVQGRVKRGKTVPVFALQDTEELAEADIQLRQQQ